MNDGWNEWAPRVPDPRMMGSRQAAPARPAEELFPLPRHVHHGDILSDPAPTPDAPGAPGNADPVGRHVDEPWALHGWAPEEPVGWGLDRVRDRPVRFGAVGPADERAMDGPTVKVSTDGEIVRPFILTAGRARPLDERLRIETLLSATPAALTAPLAFEHAHIVELCRQPLSVAEIAAGLRLPVGVARVLIADLVAEHLLVIHAQVVPGVRPPRELLERIRAGVRAL